MPARILPQLRIENTIALGPSLLQNAAAKPPCQHAMRAPPVLAVNVLLNDKARLRGGFSSWF
jgi:hypothetical protein